MAHSSRIITCDSFRTYDVVYLDLALTPIGFLSALWLELSAMEGELAKCRAQLEEATKREAATKEMLVKAQARGAGSRGGGGAGVTAACDVVGPTSARARGGRSIRRSSAKTGWGW